MMDCSEDLEFYKRERDRIKSEINDLESRIVVEGGRHNRYEVNNYRNRVNRLQMKLNDVLLKIDDLEKSIKNNDSKGQIQVIPTRSLNLPSIDNGEIAITDNMQFDCGFSDVYGDVIQTVDVTIERKIIYNDGKPVSCTETINETTTTRRLRNNDDIYVKSTIVD